MTLYVIMVINFSPKKEINMDDFLANKIIEDLMLGAMTAPEAWNNLQEAREVISDEKHDEITALITEQLIEADMIADEDDLNLEDVFSDDPELDQIEFGWDEPYPHPEDWEYGSDIGLDPNK